MTAVGRAAGRSPARRLVTAAAVGALLLAGRGVLGATAAGASPTTTTDPTTAPTTTVPAVPAAPTTALSSTTSAPTTTSEPALDALECDGPTAAGEAVRIGITWPEGPGIDLPELGESAEAARQYANECLGGIGGRPIELVDCQIDEADPRTARACAEELRDDDVVAAVATITSHGRALVPVLTAAGIPYVTDNPATPDERNNEDDLVFVITSGLPGEVGAMAQQATDDDVDGVRLFVGQPAAASVEDFAEIPFRAAGVELHVVPVATGGEEVADDVDEALVAGDVIAVAGDPTVCASVLEAVGPDVDAARWIIAPCLSPAVVDAVGVEAMSGAILFTTIDGASDEPEAALYRAVMATYQPDAPTYGPVAIGYQTLLALVRGLAGLDGDVTAETVADALRATSAVPIPAGAGAVFGCADRPFPTQTAVCSSQTIVATLDDDAEPTDPEVVDAAELFAG